MENHNCNQFAVEEWHLVHIGLQLQVVLLMILQCFMFWSVDCKVWVQVRDLGWMELVLVGGLTCFVKHVTPGGGKCIG